TKGLSVDERKVEAVHAYGELRNTTHSRRWYVPLRNSVSSFIRDIPPSWGFSYT
ncbi:10884_t:CDS:1, partial [Paraglomus occultum]